MVLRAAVIGVEVKRVEGDPPAPRGDGRGEVPGGDLGASPMAVELATARRGAGRQPRLGRGNGGVMLPSALGPAADGSLLMARCTY